MRAVGANRHRAEKYFCLHLIWFADKNHSDRQDGGDRKRHNEKQQEESFGVHGRIMLQEWVTGQGNFSLATFAFLPERTAFHIQ